MRVRFAPSPTGVLHIGGARTALYNWLAARGSGGSFVLRIEDTDRERSTPENVEQILDALTWLELDWDEGPHSQAERAPAHAAAAQELLDAGRAYEDDGAVRFRVPDEGEIAVEDLIRGEVRFPLSSLQDFVIQRSDGSPLYNLAVAVDDRDMGVTHVIRGDDHLSNTPRQALMLEALGAPRPVYAHLPLLHGPDGKKLSKRHGAASVQELRERGYLPAAVRNYIALLGWGDEDSSTFFTTEQLVQAFDLRRVSRSPAVFDEQKLRWMNGRYLRELPVEELRALLEERLGRELSTEAVAISQEKMQTLADFWPLAGFLVERSARRREGMEQGDGRGRGRAPAGRARRVGSGRSIRRRRGGERAPRGGGDAGRQAEGRVPAGASGDQRHHRLSGNLRVGGGARPRRDSAARRNRSGAGARAPLVGSRRLNLCRADADSGRDVERRAGCAGYPSRPCFTQLQAGMLRVRAVPITPPKSPEVVLPNPDAGHGRRLTVAFEALEAFPALAESRNRVLRVVREDHASVGQVVAAVESDVALVIAVLRIANRSVQRKKSKIASIPEAVEVLTPDGVEALAAKAATFDFFERTPGWDLMPERFRLHAVATQAAADRLARELDYEDRDELLCSALLHDIGKLVLAHAYPGYPEQIHGEARTPEARIRRERLELGVDHALVGACSPAAGACRTAWPSPSSATTPRTPRASRRWCASPTCLPTTRTRRRWRPTSCSRPRRPVGCPPRSCERSCTSFPTAPAVPSARWTRVRCRGAR